MKLHTAGRGRREKASRSFGWIPTATEHMLIKHPQATPTLFHTLVLCHGIQQAEGEEAAGIVRTNRKSPH